MFNGELFLNIDYFNFIFYRLEFYISIISDVS